MKKFKIFERIRKPSPDPLKFLRLNRAEFGSTFKKSNYNFENYYPDIEPLLKSVSGFYKINKESIYLGAGGESIIKDIFLFMFLKKKSNFLFNPTNFFMYKYYSDLFNFKKKKYTTFLDSKKYSINTFIKLITKNKKTDLITIVNPSHPFENFWTIKEIDKILKISKKKKIFVLLDEVYLVNNRLSACKLVRKYDNLIILKSLSKIPGLPGLRVAFAFAQKKIIRELDTVRLAIELPEYNIRKATKILKNPKKYIYPKLKMINEARNFAHKQFKKRKIQSFGNFGNSVSAIFKDEKHVKKIGEFMKMNKILINYNYGSPFKKYLNLTTTNKKNIQFFFKVFDKIKY